MHKEEIQTPFLTQSKDKMAESILQSNRVPELKYVLPYWDVFTVQKVFMRIFNKAERNYLEKNWAKNAVSKLLRTSTGQTRLPENWFREND